MSCVRWIIEGTHHRSQDAGAGITQPMQFSTFSWEVNGGVGPPSRMKKKQASRSKGSKFDCSLRERKRVNEPINLMSRWRMGAWFPRPPSLPVPASSLRPPLSSPFSFQFALPAVQCARRRSGIRMIPLNMVNRDIAKSIKYQRDILLFYCLSYKNMM